MRQPGDNRSRLSLVLCAWAVVVQIGFGAWLPDLTLPIALHNTAILCQDPSGGAGTLPPGQHHHVPINDFCPLWASFATPALPLLATVGPQLPLPVGTVFRRPGLPPPGTAPPAVPFRLAQPRAPPSLA